MVSTSSVAPSHLLETIRRSGCVNSARRSTLAIPARIAHVERRAEFTQPERRIVASNWDGATREVLTTSQKLAHRIARELQKAFGGRARYTWSDQDGALTAIWQG